MRKAATTTGWEERTKGRMGRRQSAQASRSAGCRPVKRRQQAAGEGDASTPRLLLTEIDFKSHRPLAFLTTGHLGRGLADEAPGVCHHSSGDGPGRVIAEAAAELRLRGGRLRRGLPRGAARAGGLRGDGLGGGAVEDEVSVGAGEVVILEVVGVLGGAGDERVLASRLDEDGGGHAEDFVWEEGVVRGGLQEPKCGK